MNKLLQPGRIIFATGTIALGVLCILMKDFIVGRPPAWPAGYAAVNPALGYITGVVMIILGMIIIVRKQAGVAALQVAVLILCFSLTRLLPNFTANWLAAFKSMALFGGALIVACSYPAYATRANLKNIIVFISCLLLAAFFIAGGYAHFVYAAFVTDFIPAYIPFHAFWAYFCGVCLFAGGIGIIIPQTRRIAALLSGIMLLGWFILLHIPRFLADTNNPGDRMGLCESFAFSGIFFVLAAMSPKKN